MRSTTLPGSTSGRGRRMSEVAGRDVIDDEPAVVAVAMDGAGVGRDAVLLEAGDRLRDRATRSRCQAPSCSRRRSSSWAGRCARTGSTPTEARSPSGQRKPEAAMTSSTSTTKGWPLSERRVWTAMPRVAPLEPLDRGVQDEDAAAELGILPGLDVASPYAGQGVQVDRELCRARRGQHDGAGPLQEAARDLEAGVLLADDEEALAGIAGGVPCLRVVGGQLDARRLRQRAAQRCPRRR